MSPRGCQQMSAKPCNRNAEESFPVLSFKSREQKPPNLLLIQDENVLQPSLTLCGVTTDGSALSPAPLREVCGKVPHHICQCHIVAEVVQAVLGAVASARKGLAATQPKLPRGRPRTQAAQAAARTKKRLAAQGAALFSSRYLFVQRHLNTTERKTLWRVSRGLPQLHALRAVMDQVYAFEVISI